MMKKQTCILILSAIVGLGVVAWSPPSDDDLIVGTGNAATSSTGYLGVIGTGNSAKLKDGMIVGINNSVSQESGAAYTQQSLVVGSSNVITGGRSRAFVMGNSNSVNAQNVLVAGTNNKVEAASGISYESAAIGNGNEIYSTRGWALGFTNVVTGNCGVAVGSSNTAQALESIAIGSVNNITGSYGYALGGGLTVNQSGAVAVGLWNSPMVVGDAFVIGNGTSSSKSTALRVTYGGDVILTKAQGDISMGIYN